MKHPIRNFLKGNPIDKAFKIVSSLNKPGQVLISEGVPIILHIGSTLFCTGEEFVRVEYEQNFSYYTYLGQFKIIDVESKEGGCKKCSMRVRCKGV